MDDELRFQSLRNRLDRYSDQYSRPQQSRLKRWFLFDGNRMHVTAVLLGGVFVVLVLFGAVWSIEYRRLVSETAMVQTIFNTLLGGVILLVSIVVAVTSVGVSQELTSLGKQHDRIKTAVEFRRRIVAHDEIKTSPARPGQIIIATLQAIHQQAHELESIVADHPDSNLQQDVTALKLDIETNIEELIGTLENIQAGTTDELLVGLDYDSSWQLHQTYRLQENYADQLSEDHRAVMDELGTALHELMSSREYFKTLYYKREFSELSTMLLIASLPVIVFITYVLLALDTGLFPEVTIGGLSPLAVFISLAYTIALTPYVILTAYVLRVASVTKRTPAVGPFVIGTDHQLPFDSTVLKNEPET
ncbi:hypothetical protein [Halalkalicoccus ordinarius]|uniref:hypothetical protein n=1 Tax=Halalkalicoccus ordinarius TaxID=3116651 RepID=UPI00300F2764